MHFDFGEIDSVDTKITPFANMFRFVYNDRKRQSPTVYMSTRIHTTPPPPRVKHGRTFCYVTRNGNEMSLPHIIS